MNNGPAKQQTANENRANQPTKQRMNKPPKQQINQRASKPTWNEPTNQWTNEPKNKQIKEWTKTRVTGFLPWQMTVKRMLW